MNASENLRCKDQENEAAQGKISITLIKAQAYLKELLDNPIRATDILVVVRAERSER